MKYELERLGSDNFEHLIQSLITGIVGNSAIIFGDGPDGQREAVFKSTNLTITNDVMARGKSVVQAKFKSPDTKSKDWDWLRKNLRDELEGFKKKTTTHPHIIPETFLFFTNIVLTPVLDDGIRDRAEKFVAQYKDVIPNIFILGADDIRTMLDNNRDVARCYASFIMPGDVLVELHKNLQEIKNEKFEDLVEYARQMFREDSAVRLEQAGSVSSKTINIRNVYIDLEVKAQSVAEHEIKQIAAYIIELGNHVHRRGRIDVDTPVVDYKKLQKRASEYNIVLIGNAGQGKSTLCQYICQIYRAALLRRFKKQEPETQDYLPEDPASKQYVPRCERFPILINLKRYAAWINKQEVDNSCSVISYIRSLINGRAGASLSIHDLRHLLSGYSWVFLFDGLDEVPASSNRNEVLKQIQEFLDKDLTESFCDSLVICSSRPQGYEEAFSSLQYNHYELQDMSKSLCESYIEKLLRYLEDNNDEKERYRKILHNALDDPMVSKLMTTPLYTAIIVLLVKMGGTPPTKRYSLFQEYCKIVIKRELQKETLPSLHDEYDWIIKLHAQIGFLLQTESETAENAAAELSTVRCGQLIAQFLQDEEFDGKISEKSEELYLAITNRLSFLSEVSGSDQETCVIFPLRSIQEYFAAEWLISFDNEDKLSEALEIISVSAYWRNVYLFVAGFFTKNRNRKNMNETLFRICQRNNGDENYESSNIVAFRIAMQGSHLALDLLCDNLFSRPVDWNRYLSIAAKLLDEDYSTSSLAQQFLRLPSKIAEAFLNDRVVPHIQKTKVAEGVAFEFLWLMANNGNENACAQLENLIGDVLAPSAITICKLLSKGFSKVGETAIHQVYRWITEECFSDFCDVYWPHDVYGNFISFILSHSQNMEPPFQVFRQVVYKVLNMKRFRQKEHGIRGILSSNRLLQKLIRDDHLDTIVPPSNNGNLNLIYRPIKCDRTYLTEYAQDFCSSQLNELATLTEFLHLPSRLGLEKLLEAYSELPEYCKRAFIRLISRCNWLVQEIADQLEMSESIDVLLERYDKTYIEACLKRDEEIARLVEVEDLVSITTSNYWKYIEIPYEMTIPDSLMQEILSSVNAINIDKHFIRFLNSSTKSWETILPEVAQFGIRHFPMLFQSSLGVELALKLFYETSLSFLISGNIEYPKALPISWVYYSGSVRQSIQILEKIDRLVDFGEEFLQAYALIPYCFARMKSKLLPKVPLDVAMKYYHTIYATGNRAALYGCILRILTGPVSNELKVTIWNELLELLQNDTFVFLCYIVPELFSLEGKILIYEAKKTHAIDFDAEEGFLNRYTRVILEELEANPVDQSELLELSEIAHSD